MIESQLPHLHQIRFALITGTFGNKRLSTEQSQTLLESVLHWNATDVSTFNLAVTQELIEMSDMAGIHVQIGMPGGGQCIHEINTVNQGDGRQAIFDALMFNADILCTNQPILATELLNGILSKSPLFRFKNSGAKRSEKMIRETHWVGICMALCVGVSAFYVVRRNKVEILGFAKGLRSQITGDENIGDRTDFVSLMEKEL